MGIKPSNTVYAAIGHNTEYNEDFRVPVRAANEEEAKSLVEGFGKKIGFEGEWSISTDISGNFDRSYVVQDPEFEKDGIMRLLDADGMADSIEPFAPYEPSGKEVER